MIKQPSAEVWYDGECAVCRSARNWCESHDRAGRLTFRDYRTTDDRELPVPRSAVETSLWVRDPRGRLAGGFDGWRMILAELPSWRWLARLTGMPPLSWLGPPVYRVVARSRRALR